MTLGTYRDFHFCLPESGGKAGKGCNKTSTVQVFDPTNGFLVKQIRFSMSEQGAVANAVRKGKKWVDNELEKATP